MLATTGAGMSRVDRGEDTPHRRAEHGPERHLLGTEAQTPATAPAPVPTATGPAAGSRPAAHPSGAASAALTRMRCHSAGISPGRCRRRAMASEAARAAASDGRAEDPRGGAALGSEGEPGEAADRGRAHEPTPVHRPVAHRPSPEGQVAESVGFEPTVASRPQRFSRPSHSSTLATLRAGRYRSASPALRRRRTVRSAAASARRRTPATTATSWLSRGSAPRL